MDLIIPSEELDTYTAFLEEAREHLDNMEQKVLGLADSAEPGVVDVLFRALHSIKGVASYLGLADIQRLSHHLESVFDKVRQGALPVDEGLIRVCLENLDHLKDMVSNLDAGLRAKVGTPSGFSASIAEVDYLAGFGKLESLLSGGWVAVADAPAAPAADSAMPAADPAAGDAGAEDPLITREMELAFLKEAEEVVESVEQSLLRLQEVPGDAEALSLVFRSVHSFKSNCGFFGYRDLEKLSHRLENLLDDARAAAKLTAPAGEIGLRCVDALRVALACLAKGEPPAIPGLERLLAALIRPGSRASGDAAEAGPSGAPPLGEILVEQHAATREQVDHALELQARTVGRILVDEGAVTPGDVDRALKAQVAAQAAAQALAGAGPGPETEAAGARVGGAAGAGGPPGAVRDAKRDLRVDLSKLDLLLDLVGELVISTGMVFNHPAVRDSGAADLEKISHQLKGVVNDLQSVALGVRMIPVEGPFRKMTRLVHDLSAKSGKKVKLEFRGEETEIDKNVADLIADPLVHMIRNSIDHGLESPAERTAAGKPAAGTVVLEASQEGGDILITIRDDGRGMNRGKILRKAKERGLIGEEGDFLPDEEVFRFIFMPGFSTADAVTATSGRGVGMDVVKANIDRLNGRISIRSRAGEGSAITLRIPLTLSILDGMMVRVGSSLFTLPLAAIRESISPEPGALFRPAGGQEMMMLRGKALPIVRLHRLHNLADHRREIADGILVFVETQGMSFCLFVDEILGQRQTVVKALPPFLGKVAGVSSCSILDNGDISLILDLAGIFEAHRKASEEAEPAAGPAAEAVPAAALAAAPAGRRQAGAAR